MKFLLVNEHASRGLPGPKEKVAYASVLGAVRINVLLRSLESVCTFRFSRKLHGSFFLLLRDT